MRRQQLLDYFKFSSIGRKESYMDEDQYFDIERLTREILGDQKFNLIMDKYPCFKTRSKHVYEPIYISIYGSIMNDISHEKDRKRISDFNDILRMINPKQSLLEKDIVLHCKESTYPGIDGLGITRGDYEASMVQFASSVVNGSPESATLQQEMLNRGFKILKRAISSLIKPEFNPNILPTTLEAFNIEKVIGLQVKCCQKPNSKVQFNSNSRPDTFSNRAHFRNVLDHVVYFFTNYYARSSGDDVHYSIVLPSDLYKMLQLINDHGNIIERLNDLHFYGIVWPFTFAIDPVIATGPVLSLDPAPLSAFENDEKKENESQSDEEKSEVENKEENEFDDIQSESDEEKSEAKSEVENQTQSDFQCIQNSLSRDAHDNETLTMVFRQTMDTKIVIAESSIIDQLKLLRPTQLGQLIQAPGSPIVSNSSVIPNREALLRSAVKRTSQNLEKQQQHRRKIAKTLTFFESDVE